MARPRSPLVRGPGARQRDLGSCIEWPRHGDAPCCSRNKRRTDGELDRASRPFVDAGGKRQEARAADRRRNATRLRVSARRGSDRSPLKSPRTGHSPSLVMLKSPRGELGRSASGEEDEVVARSRRLGGFVK